MLYINSAYRLPIGKAGGIYKNIIPEVLFAAVLREIYKTNKQVDEIFAANAFGTGGNMARYAALAAGFPENVPATTIDFQCSGGLKAVELARNTILSGAADFVIAGGMESKSLAPQKIYHQNDFRANSKGKPYTTARFSPFQTPDFKLLDAAKAVALKYKIRKDEMLEWTIESHKNAAELSCKNALSSFICKINDADFDQTIRSGFDFEKLSTSDLIDRTVSAHYNDGAAAVLLSKEKILDQTQAKIIASASVGWLPELAPEAVIPATKKVLKLAGLKISDIDIFEVNESFSVIPLIFAKNFRVEANRINVLGGNLAYGHPFGASGTINLIHLIATLKARKLKRGLVALPAAGGLASAMIVENVI